MRNAPRLQRRIKVRGGNLGAFLCWAVVFADIGTSVYYVPGILYGPFGSRSALFVLLQGQTTDIRRAQLAQLAR